MAKGMYIGVNKEIPIYDTETVNVTASNISEVFTVTNGSYYFKGNGSVFTTNNGGVKSSTAKTTLTAKTDMEVSFSYSYSSEASYDKFTLTVGGTTIENGVSGSTTTKSYSGSLQTGDTIVFQYVKDSSKDANDDQCTFSNMVVTAKIQTGTTVSPVARKCKRAYIGVGGKARKIKKMYIGIAGKARLFFNSLKEVTNHLCSSNDLDGLVNGRKYLGAVSVGNYALFGGGDFSASSVEAYNTSLTRSTVPTGLSSDGARTNPATAKVGNYGVFAGGRVDSYSTYSDMDIYDSSLTKSTATLSTSRSSIAGASIGNYAIFAGGDRSTPSHNSTRNTVDTLNTSLSRSTATSLSASRGECGATTVGNYALIAGGSSYNEYDLSVKTYSAVVDTYNASLTKGTATALTVGGRMLHGAVTVGNYALFGGMFDGDVSSVVEVYNSSLTKQDNLALSVGRYYLSASSLDGIALFMGGTTGSSSSSVVDVFDTNLTRTTAPDLCSARYHSASATVGKYIVIAGGYANAYASSSSVVDAYEIS